MGYKGIDRKGLMFLLALGPLLFFPFSYEEFRGTRETVFHLVALAVFLSVAVESVLRLRRGERPLPVMDDIPGFRQVMVFLSAIPLSMLVSYAANEHTMHGLRGVLNSAAGVFVFYALTANIGRGESGKWIAVFGFAAFPNALLATLQYFGLDPFFLSLDPEYHALYPRYKVSGFMDSPNMLAPFLASMVPYFFLSAVYAGWGRKFFFKAAVILFLLTPIALSRNMAAWFALGLTLAGLLLFVTFHRLRGGMIEWQKLAVCWAAIALVGAGGVAAYARSDQESKTVKSWSMMERMDQYGVAWEMFKEAPLPGKGPGYFYRHYVEYRRLEWFDGPPSAITFRTAHQAHNDYLQALAEGGILLFAAIVAAVGSFKLVLFRRLRALSFTSHPDDASLTSVGAAGGLLVIALNALLSFPFHVATLATTAAFWGAMFYNSSRSVADEGER